VLSGQILGVKLSAIFPEIQQITIYLMRHYVYHSSYGYTDTIPNQQISFALMFTVALGIKVPVFPFHLWLPEVHSETDTCGSVLLAGVLLKVGSYGLMRFTLTLFPVGYSY
jgi:NADH:ubiquinone oxidoreductase subunit 4 (subunit M)